MTTDERVHAELHNAVRRSLGSEAIDVILAKCPDAECYECGRIVCPYHEPLHFHHDGCPACAERTTLNDPKLMEAD